MCSSAGKNTQAFGPHTLNAVPLLDWFQFVAIHALSPNKHKVDWGRHTTKVAQGHIQCLSMGCGTLDAIGIPSSPCTTEDWKRSVSISADVVFCEPPAASRAVPARRSLPITGNDVVVGIDPLQEAAWANLWRDERACLFRSIIASRLRVSSKPLKNLPNRFRIRMVYIVSFWWFINTYTTSVAVTYRVDRRKNRNKRWLETKRDTNDLGVSIRGSVNVRGSKWPWCCRSLHGMGTAVTKHFYGHQGVDGKVANTVTIDSNGHKPKRFQQELVHGLERCRGVFRLSTISRMVPCKQSQWMANIQENGDSP